AGGGERRQAARVRTRGRDSRRQRPLVSRGAAPARGRGGARGGSRRGGGARSARGATLDRARREGARVSGGVRPGVRVAVLQSQPGTGAARRGPRFHRESPGSGWKAPLGRSLRIAQPAAALPGTGPVAAPLLRRGDEGARSPRSLRARGAEGGVLATLVGPGGERGHGAWSAAHRPRSGPGAGARDIGTPGRARERRRLPSG